MSANAMKIWVYGIVQGVGFRYSTQKKARELGLRGYARNLDDGSVEILAAGDRVQIDALLNWLKKGGPTSARVEQVRSEPSATGLVPEGFAIQ